MPMMQTTLAGLNTAFSEPKIAVTAAQRERFAPNQPLHDVLADHGAPDDKVLHRALKEHLRKMPPAISESLRATLHHALGTVPPTHVTFSWAPAYDHEIHIWQAPDTAQTRGGVTVLVKSRYPDDAHPLAGG